MSMRFACVGLLMALSGCATQYYHRELRETKQQYYQQKQVLQTIQDHFYAFAVSRENAAATTSEYYLIGEHYIYKIRDPVWNPQQILARLDPQDIRLKPKQRIVVELQAHENPQQQIRLSYQLQYLKPMQLRDPRQPNPIAPLWFQRDGQYQLAKVSSIGQLLQKQQLSSIQSLQYFDKAYPIEIQVYQTQWVKDGNPHLNNLKGYGISALVDIVTLPLQLIP